MRNTRGRSGVDKPTRRREKEKARERGMAQVPLSGAGTEKGDWRIPGVLVEDHKSTKHKSFKVDAALMIKLQADATKNGDAIAALVIEGDGFGVAVLPIQHYDELLRRANVTHDS